MIWDEWVKCRESPHGSKCQIIMIIRFQNLARSYEHVFEVLPSLSSFGTGALVKLFCCILSKNKMIPCCHQYYSLVGCCHQYGVKCWVLHMTIRFFWGGVEVNMTIQYTIFFSIDYFMQRLYHFMRPVYVSYLSSIVLHWEFEWVHRRSWRNHCHYNTALSGLLFPAFYFSIIYFQLYIFYIFLFLFFLIIAKVARAQNTNLTDAGSNPMREKHQHRWCQGLGVWQ